MLICAILLRIWKTKSSSQMGALFFYPMFANWARAKNDVGSRFWKWKFVAKIAETEIARYFKTFKIWVFFEKIDGFFEKKLEFYSKSLKMASLLENAYQMVFFLKMSSTLIGRFFWQKIRKLWTWTLEKLDTMMKECFFFEKKTFSSF